MMQGTIDVECRIHGMAHYNERVLTTTSTTVLGLWAKIYENIMEKNPNYRYVARLDGKIISSNDLPKEPIRAAYYKITCGADVAKQHKYKFNHGKRPCQRYPGKGKMRHVPKEIIACQTITE